MHASSVDQLHIHAHTWTAASSLSSSLLSSEPVAESS